MDHSRLKFNKTSRTFCHFPSWDLKSGISPKIAFVGIPWSEGKTHSRAGQKLSPHYLRTYSARYFFNKVSPFEAKREIRIEDNFFVADLGDLVLPPVLEKEAFDKTTFLADEILKKGALPLSIGGNHSISYPILRAYQRHQNIVLINLDAHLDFKFGNDDVPGYGSENVMRRIIELGNITHIINIGTRGIAAEKHFKEARKDKRIHIHKANDWKLAHLIKQLKSLKPQGVYVSLDIDVLDPSIAPGCSSPEAGGLNYMELERIITALTSEFNIIGFDLVEINPLADKSSLTACVAVQLLLDFIFTLSLKK